MHKFNDIYLIKKHFFVFTNFCTDKSVMRTLSVKKRDKSTKKKEKKAD